MTDTAGTGDTTVTGGLTAGSPVHRAVPDDAGRRLERECLEMFPRYHPCNFPVGTEWQTAVEHGATIAWAVRVPGPAADADRVPRVAAFQVWKVLRLGFAVPVSIIDELIAYGWTVQELYDLMGKKGYEDLIGGGFPNTVRRLSALHQVAPGLGGPDGGLLWQVLAALMSAGPAGLTDPQALRWLQALVPPCRSWSRFGLAVSLAEDNAEVLQEWVRAAGPDGWSWPEAGYTPDQARMLLGLPETHPDRPGPDQLAVMAALRET